MDEDEKLTQLQELLTEAYVRYITQKQRGVKENAFARFLGVKPGSFNAWSNGNRAPNYPNAILLASGLSKIDKDYGVRVYDILGYNRVPDVSDPDLLYVIDHWSELDDETRKQIFEHTREESERTRYKRG